MVVVVVVVVVVLVLLSVPTVPGSMVVGTFSDCAWARPTKATNISEPTALITVFMAFDL
ncbi:hypothetical protein GCM10025791_17460 [Halioxenophilus aromaticivorans]|uniref:Secreted peptide n=1 Tax=Halioxenophilus aromaticivorans TaxID=1306992 RepID=A0AAV3U1L2_9ALTE